MKVCSVIFSPTVIYKRTESLVFALNPNNLQLTVGILIFDQVEVLDVAGPFEVFSVTRLNEERGWKEPFPFSVILVS